jgi:hypothetical protein
VVKRLWGARGIRGNRIYEEELFHCVTSRRRRGAAEGVVPLRSRTVAGSKWLLISTNPSLSNNGMPTGPWRAGSSRYPSANTDTVTIAVTFCADGWGSSAHLLPAWGAWKARITAIRKQKILAAPQPESLEESRFMPAKYSVSGAEIQLRPADKGYR